MNLNTPLSELKLIAFDLETSGKYPVGFEICEMAAVKWHKGQVIETFESLIKPSKTMSEEVIAIHGITNEMVTDQASISEKISACTSNAKGTDASPNSSIRSSGSSRTRPRRAVCDYAPDGAEASSVR